MLEAVPPIYDKLFPSAVAGIMKGDITGGVAIVREAMGSIPGGKGATLAGMIKHHISTLGKDKCAAEKKNGTKVHRARARHHMRTYAHNARPSRHVVARTCTVLIARALA